MELRGHAAGTPDGKNRDSLARRQLKFLLDSVGEDYVSCGALLITEDEDGDASMREKVFAVHSPSSPLFGRVFDVSGKRAKEHTIVDRICAFAVKFFQYTVDDIVAYAVAVSGDNAEAVSNESARQLLNELLCCVWSPWGIRVSTTGDEDPAALVSLLDAA